MVYWIDCSLGPHPVSLREPPLSHAWERGRSFCYSAIRQALMRYVRRLHCRLLGYAPEDLGQVGMDRVVAETNDPVPERFQNPGPISISLLLLLVSRPIHLNDQLGGCTVEVCNVSLDRMLTSELQTCELSASQLLPEQALGFSRISSELTRTRPNNSICSDWSFRHQTRLA